MSTCPPVISERGIRDSSAVLHDRAHAAPHLHRTVSNNLTYEVYRRLRIRLDKVGEQRPDARLRVPRKDPVVIQHHTKLFRDKAGFLLVEQREEQLRGLARRTRRRHERTQVQEHMVELGPRRLRRTPERAQDARLPSAARNFGEDGVGLRLDRHHGGRRVDRAAHAQGLVVRLASGGRHVHVREGRLHRVHSHGADPAARVDLALDVDGDEAAPSGVPHDHVQALDEVAAHQASDALAPQVHCLLGAQRLRQQLPPPQVQRLNVLLDDLEQPVVAPRQVLKHQPVPLPQRRRNLVDDGLNRPGCRVVARFQGRSGRERFKRLRLGGRRRPDAGGIDWEPSTHRVGLIWRRGQLERLARYGIPS